MADPLVIDSSHDLRADPLARHVRRRAVALDVQFNRSAGVVTTAEGPVKHGAGAAILTGVAGEKWPIERTRFEALYEPIPPLRMGEDGQYRRKPTLVLARQLDRPFAVTLTDGRGRLDGTTGDWLVQHDPGQLGIVNREVFAATYELLDPP